MAGGRLASVTVVGCTRAVGGSYGTGVGGSAAATTGGGVHGFPAALTSFIGRAGPVREVVGLLERYRLVTVTGPGGAGKTRLAGEVAGQVAGRFADGVWLAELAPVRDAAQVTAAVAAALGVRERPGVPAADRLAQVLGRQQVLLVLDNCEHVIGAAAALCAGLLLACDDLKILVTSREPLRVAGEARYRLASLSLPDPEDAGRSEAVALFADRARAADPRFALDGGNQSAVARLVQRLDGMPLAIELAAARVEALGVAQLLERIDDRFALLVAGDRLAAGRQRSLAAAVQWSYQLLGERERRVFRAVSVFPAGFTLAAAEAVAGDAAGPVVLRLVDCSLVVPPQAGPDGRSRYVMLETLRAYGAGLLAEAGELDGAVAGLARYALQVAGQAAAGLQTSTGEVAAVRWLDAEDATLRQVLAWATEHDPDISLRLAVALAPWWLLRGRLAGHYQLLREVVGRAAPGSQRWCDGQLWLGRMAEYSDDMAAALGHFSTVGEAIRDRGPSRALADCLSGRSMALANLSRLPEAAEDGRRALALARKLDYPAGEALALDRLSITACYAGDLDGAVRLARQAEQLPADITGWIARDCGSILTWVLMEAGDLAAAEDTCAAWLARARELDDLQILAELLIWMAIMDVDAGRTGDAAEHLREGLQVTARTGGWPALGNALECCGYLCAATGRPAEALTMWAAYVAYMLHEGHTEPPSSASRLHDAQRDARQALGATRARTAEERGEAMSAAIAAEYALSLTAPAGLPSASPARGRLSAREQELVTLVARGRSDAQIAAELYISIRTVRSHLDRIRDKTGARRRADLTRLALAAGLV
jgi:predicted ATPase/DNA-binding CsgD family transcriptional regulator